ncbi:uncharacterized protein LOC126725062 [Quercus robur]|uniref:uncharacterized protein LOC126725062 n=1 Tax=Quercus robur TaxID=38942 RepID=UPI002162F108|nr:uncharacterized protein LOC126725062 [Quercus robur]
MASHYGYICIYLKRPKTATQPARLEQTFTSSLDKVDLHFKKAGYWHVKGTWTSSSVSVDFHKIQVYKYLPWMLHQRTFLVLHLLEYMQFKQTVTIDDSCAWKSQSFVI